MSARLNAGERITALEESRKAQDRENEKVNAMVTQIGGKLDDMAIKIDRLVQLQPDLQWIITTAKEQRGATRLGKWVVGSGFFAAVGAMTLGIYHFFSGKGFP